MMLGHLFLGRHIIQCTCRGDHCCTVGCYMHVPGISGSTFPGVYGVMPMFPFVKLPLYVHWGQLLLCHTASTSAQACRKEQLRDGVLNYDQA